MHVSRHWLIPTLVACVLLLAAVKADEPKVELRAVKYDKMGELIKDFKGKIVVVDFWADT